MKSRVIKLIFATLLLALVGTITASATGLFHTPKREEPQATPPKNEMVFNWVSSS